LQLAQPGAFKKHAIPVSAQQRDVLQFSPMLAQCFATQGAGH